MHYRENISRANWHFDKARVHLDTHTRLLSGPVEYQADTFPVVCSCGRSHDLKDWKALKRDGLFIAVVYGRRFGHDLEHRTCLNCRSTMSARIKG